MPNTFTDGRDRWLQMSDVDYLGQFVKAWLAFNAWYRSAHSETQDRKIIEAIKWSPNQVAAKFRQLLEHNSADAEQFRNEIGLLHHRLERYEIHYGKGNKKTRIRFSKIVIRTEPPVIEETTFRSWKCKVERVANGNVTVVITMPYGTTKVNLAAHTYDPTQLDTNAEFVTIPDTIKARFCACYAGVNPRIERNLTTGDEDLIECGPHQFRCGPNFLFSGVVEVIYLMRCSLFHGELVPTPDAAECYEPAYRIVRRFLNSLT